MNGKVLVDKEDRYLLPKISGIYKTNKRSRTFYVRLRNNKYIHRVIIGAKKGQLVDHINGNGLDNRKNNLNIY